ncbi:MAG: Gfo/Idh/MocA family oxidoreductase [Verrucomicrobia bacterium]|nr:Gfo/Idh/MocA family oxidoreductase [Verrucomicrobiota bacterium]
MNAPQPLTRRQFVTRSATAGASVALLAGPRRTQAAPASKVTLGIMGLGGRGAYLAQAFANRPDTNIAYICDVDTRKFARTRDAVEEAQGKAPKQVQDFRRILEDKSVDAIVNATPDHWHVPAAILACQAGKDVYVEKPMSHNAWEGRKLIEAAEKYKRVIQVGMQSRSARYLADAVEHIRGGKLGDVHVIRVFNMMQHFPRKKPTGAPVAVPAGYDHDLWCGPAPLLPYDPSRRWLDQWEFSCGAIPGDAVHQLDLARVLLGDRPFPDTVVHSGGVNALTDGREIPDTQMVLYEYGKLTLIFESALWTPYMTKTPTTRRDKGEMPNWPFNATRIEVLGTKGLMYFGRHGDGWQVFNEKAESVVSVAGRQADKEHQDNFLDCIRSRKEATANARQGHYSAMLSHLANISFRVGNRKLTFDARTETFPDAPEANRFLKRTYRAPWAVSDPV